MSSRRPGDGAPEVVAGAARALAQPADADLSLLSAVHLGLRGVGGDAVDGLPRQRPTSHGEDALAARPHN